MDQQVKKIQFSQMFQNFENFFKFSNFPQFFKSFKKIQNFHKIGYDDPTNKKNSIFANVSKF